MIPNRSQRGFTLIELLIVVAIIGIIAALLVPNFLDAMQKAKQKRCVADIRIVGTAMMSWLTDEAGGAAAAGQDTNVDLTEFDSVQHTTLETVLIPQYIQEIPPIDGWKNQYHYWFDTDQIEDNIFAIRSTGRDGTEAGDTYDPGSFDPIDYDQDIVWADGLFVRWPEGS